MQRERVQQSHMGEEPVCLAGKAAERKPPSRERGGRDAKTTAADQSCHIAVVGWRLAESEGCWKPPAAGLTRLLPIPAMGTFADKLPREDKSARGLRVRALQNSNNAKNNVINP